MKNYFLLACLFCTAFLPACNEDKEKDFCNNGMLDSPAGETEIDCGGPCEPCPPAEALSATYLGYSYVANSMGGNLSGSAIGINSQGTSGLFIAFTFVGTDLNTALPITGATIDDASSYYTYELSDTGSVTLTAHDAKRKIISGRFSFSATDYYGSAKTTVQNGVFSNVRYY